MYKKNIFLVSTRWFGSMSIGKDLIKFLQKKNYNIYVLGQKDSKYLQYNNKKVNKININFKRKYLSPISDFFDLIKILFLCMKLKPIAIHCFNPKPTIIIGIAMLIYRKCFFFIGVTGLGNTVIKTNFFKNIFLKIFKIIAKRASFIFFSNPDDKNFFIKKKIVDKKKIKLFIGPGVDTNIFKKKKYTKKNITILTVGRLLWQKGIGEFLHIVKKFYRNKKIKFLLIGEYDNDHPDRIPKKFIEKNKKKYFFKHIQWTNNIKKYYNISDILFFHSYREGTPRAILESYACELPVVAANVIGVKDIVIHGKSGFLFKKGNLKSAEKYLNILVANRNKRIHFGKYSRKLVEENYSLKKSTLSQLEMYKECNLI